jgi:hypothetical protein
MATKTSRNDSPNTPDVSESKIARMKVDELRRRLKDHGVKGTDDLKKPDLVKKLVKAEKKALSGSAGKKSASSAKKSTSAASAASAASGKKKSTSASASGKKKSTSASATKNEGDGGKRTGKATSDSLKYAQEIKSTDDRPERAGRSLVTTDHEVIRRWAKARKAVPATVEGTEHGGHLGVLRFDFPGYSGDRLTEVGWDDWFKAFDKRGLNFIYQETRTDRKRSNFFQLENPND